MKNVKSIINRKKLPKTKTKFNKPRLARIKLFNSSYSQYRNVSTRSSSYRFRFKRLRRVRAKSCAAVSSSLSASLETTTVDIRDSNSAVSASSEAQTTKAHVPSAFKNIRIISIRSDRAASMMRRLGEWKSAASILWGTHWRTINPRDWISMGKIRSLHVHKRHKPLSRGEIGCYDSHYRVWKQIVKSGNPYTLILEDDAEISMIHMNRLVELSKLLESRKNWDVVVLYTIQCPRGLSKRSYIKTTLKPLDKMTGLAGYVVTLEGAKKLVKHAYPISGPVDALVPLLSSRGQLRLFRADPPLGGQINRRDSDTRKN